MLVYLSRFSNEKGWIHIFLQCIFFLFFYIDILLFQVTFKDEIQTAPASPPLPQFQAILKYKKNKLRTN